MKEIIKNFKFNFRYVMAFTSLVACFTIIILLIYVKMPTDNKDLFNVLATMFFTYTIQKAFRALYPDKDDIKSTSKS